MGRNTSEIQDTEFKSICIWINAPVHRGCRKVDIFEEARPPLQF